MAHADTTNLIDGRTGFAVMSPTSPRIIQNGLNPLCWGEDCEAIVVAPSLGASIADSTIRRDQPPIAEILISEPDGIGISDMFLSDVELGADS